MEELGREFMEERGTPRVVRVLAKGMWELKKDPDFEELLSPLDKETYDTLRSGIERAGCTETVKTWNGIIVDGHNRYKICWELNEPFGVTEMEFTDKGEAILWMIDMQIGRRNITAFQRTALALKKREIYAEKAKGRMLAGVKVDNPSQNSDQGTTKGRTDEHIAKDAGVSRDTVARVKKLQKYADEDTKDKLRRGELSINKAYTETIQKQHAGEMRVCERCGKEKPFEDFPLRPGKSRYETVCKECEAERKKEVQDMPSGMSSVGGFIRHSGYQLPDEPESFPKVQQQMQIALDNCVDSLELAFQNYTTGMKSAENDKIVDDLISSAFRRIRQMNNEHKKEANNHE